MTPEAERTIRDVGRSSGCGTSATLPAAPELLRALMISLLLLALFAHLNAARRPNPCERNHG